MKLISATPSPYARKVRIALAEKGIEFDLVTEVPWNSDTTVPDHNPLEKVPVLILDDGTALYDSLFILEWLENNYPYPGLFPRDADKRLAARRLDVLASGICDAVVLILFERMRPEGAQSAAWLDRQLRKVNGGLRELDRLVPDAEFCIAGRFSLADIAVGAALGYIDTRLPEVDWRTAYPKLDALLSRLMERPSFAETVPVPQQIEDGVI